MQDTAFTPTGPTYLIGTAFPVQALSSNNAAPTSYRIRNTSTNTNYISWWPPLASGNSPVFASTAPVAGTPAVNTIGMIGTSVEVLSLPSNCWFIGNASGFEVTPGEGL